VSGIVKFLVFHAIGCFVSLQLGSALDLVAALLLRILKVWGVNSCPLTEVTVVFFFLILCRYFGIVSEFLAAFVKL
jgi:hypothetical protein